jgi:hypothetical protein
MSRKLLVPFQLPADPTLALEAATKQYVDGIVVPSATDPIGANPQAELWIDTVTNPPAAPLASQISFSPTGLLTDTNVQAAIVRLPRGFVAIHSIAAPYTTTGTHTTYQDDGLTVTINEESTRRYRISISQTPYASGGANQINIALLRNGVIVRSWDMPLEALAIGYGHSVQFQHYVVGVTAAGVIYKTQIKAGSNNTAVSTYGSGSIIRQLLIEDIGAV